MNLLKEHRDRCLSHSDYRVTQCSHLDNISSLDTKKIIDDMIEFLDSLSFILKSNKFNFKKLDKLKSKMLTENYNRIKKLEM
ncbi:hypothetical protein [Francisella orientalis]|uniref:HEPN AbiU2-like domain-containing protein n=1 Tax=Francisella orientalis TaxID=299583 RepID=A0AAP7KJU0_9GAMM|nr:hypothetical protein [Francisella orientalis]AHB99058.1 hypothetical protein M973_01145 [Francisella orientalis LADL 07-285A]AKN84949.1 hypothetical protein FNO12_0147 [Francisella orientalis FNO12]AKN86487.1 Hypothetical protein FNO24_0147 [Francisella orientalis FNO24]AKN88025.1 Hypothetical protein FNO190_0147 [Francisella orientalis]AKU04779.1 Hypothetical protein FNO01_0147 [Francisella orientalis]